MDESPKYKPIPHPPQKVHVFTLHVYGTNFKITIDGQLQQCEFTISPNFYVIFGVDGESGTVIKLVQ